MSTAERVLNILVDVAETDEVRQDPNVQLYELDLLDSLKTVELLVALSEEFGVELSPAEFEREQWATPQQIVAYMERRVGG
jgi:D-alanine--poly(phosphoribitol) ligase subunit 2